MSPWKADRSDTGYEGEEEQEETPATFLLLKAEHHFSSKLAAIIYRGKVGVGVVHLSSEAEYEWLKARIDGRYIPSD